VALHLSPAAGLLTLLLLCIVPAAPDRTAAGSAADAPRLGQLWSEPGNLERADLTAGSLGRAAAPDPGDTFTFIKTKTRGTSPGLKVRDPRGRTWHVKQGREAQPETVVSHVLSAIGYRQPPVYFLPSFTIADASGTRVGAGGRFRLTDASLKERSTWDWERNPFVGSKPYQALLVVLVVLNSADLKNSNNTVYDVAASPGGDEQWYVVRDLGTSLGAISRIDPTPNDLEVFERRRFVTGIRDGFVEFDDYRAIHRELLTRTITVDDVRWAATLLGRLSDRQWRDAFAGAGYEPAAAQRFVRRIAQKIAEGRALGGSALPTFGPVFP
jgi:hypothetical protein